MNHFRGHPAGTATSGQNVVTVTPALHRHLATAARLPARRVGVLLLVIAGILVTAAPPAAADWVRDDQWQLAALTATRAWQYANGTGVTVAVLDSGVQADHPDLVGQVLPGADFVDGSTDGRYDFVGHGTTVAALIAGRDDDGAGVVGLAPRAKILPVRVLDSQNRYNDATVVAGGLRWAVDHGARVVNMSLGGSTPSPALADALGYAAANDVVVIACTGNATTGGPSEVWFPAREPGVVAVTGLAPGAGRTAPGGGTGGGQVTLWSGSLTGPETVLAAPAVNLLGARPGGYWRVQGTSFAAPLVTAAAALIRSRFPTLDAANVVNRLIRTAHDLGPPGRDDEFGYGEVDPAESLAAPVPPVTGNPLTERSPDAGPAPAPSANRWTGTDVDPDPPGLARARAAVPGSGRLLDRAALTGLAFLLILGGWTALVGRGTFGRRPPPRRPAPAHLRAGPPRLVPIRRLARRRRTGGEPP